MSTSECGVKQDDLAFFTGNYFHTRKEGEAKAELNDHIVEMGKKYGIPETGDSYYMRFTDEKTISFENESDYIPFMKADFYSGLLMSKKLTLAERNKRNRLLNKVYN